MKCIVKDSTEKQHTSCHISCLVLMTPSSRFSRTLCLSYTSARW